MSDLLTTDAKALQLLFHEELYLINTPAAAPVQLNNALPVKAQAPEFDYLGENNRFFCCW